MVKKIVDLTKPPVLKLKFFKHSLQYEIYASLWKFFKDGVSKIF